jgi:raffinose/stachyose/melibiose transport system permease protein
MCAAAKTDRGKRFFLNLLVALIGLLIVIPISIVVLGSFKTSAETLVPNLNLPERWMWSNYVYVYEKGKIGRALLNSVFLTTVVVLICLIISALCAFVLSRRKNRYTKAADMLFKMGMIAPMSVIPTLLLMQKLHLSGTYLSAILLYTAINLPWAVFIYSNFMRALPRTLEEAAIIDGCGPFRLFMNIVFPLLKNVTVTNIVVIAMGVWNDFMIPIYFFTSSSKWTLPMSVYNFYGLYFRDWNYVFADLIITSLPMVLLYLFAQKYIVSGLMAGSVKG